jgi:ubiquinol-cytochrome c reductase cytochrome c subunit
VAIRSTDLRTRRARHSDHSAATRLLVGGPALALVAGLLVAVFSSPGASAGSAPDGRSVYLRDCASCHAADGTGSSNGPTLQGVGAAAVDYQVSTGRMPLPSPHASSRRRTPAYDPATIAALVTFVGTIAPGGPGIPTVDVAGANIGNGGQLFRAQCAACHQWAGEGGALRFGNAPSLAPATPTQIAEAVRTGPAAMPVFGQAALDDTQLRDLVGYVGGLDHPNDAGGEPLWHLGPLAEGGAALLALAGLVVALRWMGTRT